MVTTPSLEMHQLSAICAALLNLDRATLSMTRSGSLAAMFANSVARGLWAITVMLCCWQYSKRPNSTVRSIRLYRTWFETILCLLIAFCALLRSRTKKLLTPINQTLSRSTNCSTSAQYDADPQRFNPAPDTARFGAQSLRFLRQFRPDFYGP